MTESSQSFIALYDEFLPRIYHYVLYRVSDIPLAEDITANIFEKALRNWHKLRNPQAAAGWLFRIARNTVTSHYQKNSNKQEIPLDNLDIAPATDYMPEEEMLRTTRWEKIRQGMHTLSEQEQELLILKFSSGLKNKAIARITDLKAGHVAVIVHRALRKLQAYVDDNTNSI